MTRLRHALQHARTAAKAARVTLEARAWPLAVLAGVAMVALVALFVWFIVLSGLSGPVQFIYDSF